ncbi:hypothetical protein EDB89DRAFT_1976624 [Lactarius sanguifluus]|nr:hypothetical protein EDB89DRAFT_1976624 [Lactarius sanguifluus]
MPQHVARGGQGERAESETAPRGFRSEAEALPRKVIKNGGDHGRRLVGRRTVLATPYYTSFFLPFAHPTAYAWVATDDGIPSSLISIFSRSMSCVVLFYIFCSVDQGVDVLRLSTCQYSYV